MNTKAENAFKGAVGFFFIILAGSLLSAIMGGAFGALVAAISPEFVSSLFGPQAETGIIRYAFAVSMIWGAFIGAGVSGFSCFLAATIKILRFRFEYMRGPSAKN